MFFLMEREILEEYLLRCSEICERGGYTALSSSFDRIKGFLVISFPFEKIEKLLDSYLRVTLEYCEELMKDGTRIFGWDDINESMLRERLKKI